MNETLAEPAPLADSKFFEIDRGLMIFGHPAHELALFGCLQCHQPQIVVLTDGGSAERIRQSQEGLASIGLDENVTYFSFSEAMCYEALLGRDVSFFRHMSDAVRREIDRVQPDQIICDAVEFYNPVHDITLPIVRAATASATIYEVPLVYQTAESGESYRIQRTPDRLGDRRRRYHLEAAELRSKLHARDCIYLSLQEQAGPEFAALTAEHLSVEEIFEAGDPLDEPEISGRNRATCLIA